VSSQGKSNPYDAIASLYDRWNTSVVEDIDFYTDEAVGSGGPALELGVGTGRIAIPIAQAGIAVIGVDSSAPMLERCRERAREAESPSSSIFVSVTCAIRRERESPPRHLALPRLSPSPR